ncbi:MAG: hypothetical protein ACKVPX_06560 [Myxococcaceae bacterium]
MPRLRAWACLTPLLIGNAAWAYPIFIKHGYVACASCHQDPSGAGLLTPYGRAQTELLLETQYGKKLASPEGEASANTRPFYGVPVPEWLLAGLTVRGGALLTKTANPALAVPQPAVVRPLLMVLDLRAGVVAGIFRASASLGYVPRATEAASVTRAEPGTLHRLVSREHWLGVSVLDDVLHVRAGRMSLPFGIRTVEHTLFVRDATRTNLNDQQQHGVAVALNLENVRAEVMGIAGNFQIRPDDYRERGYSGHAEYAPLPNLGLGISSLMTFARVDTNQFDTHPMRGAHGVFARYAPSDKVALLAEVDVLLRRADQFSTTLGYAAWGQVDYEPIRGLHGIVSLEGFDAGGSGTGGSTLGAWFGVSWFAARGLEIRLDTLVRRIPVPLGRPIVQSTTVAQLHVYM